MLVTKLLNRNYFRVIYSNNIQSEKRNTAYIILQISVKDIVVLINSDRINVTDEKACCSYDVLLPYTLKADNAKAFLDYNIGVRIYMYIIFYIRLYI